MDQAKKMLTDVTYCAGPYECAEGADALVIVTEWEQFRALEFDVLKRVMGRPVVVDLRNIYQPEELIRHGFVYEPVGRAAAEPAREVAEPVLAPLS
jgi:UDPglucose 6-dehydrogenase